MAIGKPDIVSNVDDVDSQGYRLKTQNDVDKYIHTDMVYVALMSTIKTMENRLKQTLENYQQHPDVQANLQQLQYDLQQWNLALTTMTNINKNLGDALNSIASNFR